MLPERTRFAPSPTGSLHIGSLRTALWCVFLARQTGGQFLLRIEDTDQKRLVEDGVIGIIRDLKAFGIEADEGPRELADGSVEERGDCGPYVQSARLPIYQQHAQQLVESGHAYACFCTPERLEQMRKDQQAQGLTPSYDRACLLLSKEERAARCAAGESHVIRLQMPEGTSDFVDAIRGRISFPNKDIDDPILLKGDGFPTYHLAVVVDDHLMGITTVLRGEEWLPSTPKHLALYAAFGWQPTRFAHAPLLLNPDKSKLSKRQGDVSARSYLERGYLPEALMNFIATLGFNPKGDQELYSLQELEKLFALEQVKPSGAVLNMEKLDWMNRHYLKALSAEALAKRLAIAEPEAWQLRALAVEQARATTLQDIVTTLPLYREWRTPSLKDLTWKDSSPEATYRALHAAMEWIQSAQDEQGVGDLEQALRAWIAEHDFAVGAILSPLRIALSGRTPSPSPFELLFVLGKDESLRRLQACLPRV